MMKSENIEVNSRRYRFHDFLPQPYSPKCAGIYAIINRENGKIYIGSSVNLRHRWSCHRNDLLLNRHNSIYFQRAFEKSPSDFYIEVVEELNGASKENIISREQFWLDFYKSYIPKNGYNLCPKAKSCMGIKRSPEFIEKVSNAGRKPWTEERKARWKIIRPKSSYRIGWKWSLEVRKKLSDSHKGKKWSDDRRSKTIQFFGGKSFIPPGRPVSQISKNGNLIENFKSIADAAKKLTIPECNIRGAIKHPHWTAGGFVWRDLNART